MLAGFVAAQKGVKVVKTELKNIGKAREAILALIEKKKTVPSGSAEREAAAVTITKTTVK